MILFNRFPIVSKWSDDGLWWVDIKDGSRQHQMISLSIVERTFEEGTYHGLQFIVWKWCLTVGDRHTFVPAQKEPSL